MKKVKQTGCRRLRTFHSSRNCIEIFVKLCILNAYIIVTLILRGPHVLFGPTASCSYPIERFSFECREVIGFALCAPHD